MKLKALFYSAVYLLLNVQLYAGVVLGGEKKPTIPPPPAGPGLSVMTKLAIVAVIVALPFVLSKQRKI